MSFPLLYSTDELAVMWCRLNAGRHPTNPAWRFKPENIGGAMALITVLVGPSKCLQTWRRRQVEGPEPFERRKVPRSGVSR